MLYWEDEYGPYKNATIREVIDNVACLLEKNTICHYKCFYSRGAQLYSQDKLVGIYFYPSLGYEILIESRHSWDIYEHKTWNDYSNDALEDTMKLYNIAMSLIKESNLSLGINNCIEK